MKTTTTKVITPIERGTIIHKLMELKINKAVGSLTNELMSSYYEIKNLVTDEMNEEAQNATDRVLKIYEFYRERYPLAIICTESHTYWKTGHGIIDVYIETHDTIHIIDLKTGGAYQVYNPTDSKFIGYSAGILDRTKQENIEKIRITVIDTRDNKKSQEYDVDSVRHWDEEQHRIEKERKVLNTKGALAKKIRKYANEIDNVAPEDITGELLDACEELVKARNGLKRKAKKEVEEKGKEIEGWGLVETNTQKVKDKQLLDYLKSRNYPLNEAVLKAFKPQKGAINDNLTAEEIAYVDENEIFYSQPSGRYAFRKIN